jgi:hypothetical protein
MALRDGIIKVLRGGVNGAEKLTRAGFRGLEKGVDWLDSRGRPKDAAADTPNAGDPSGADAASAGEVPADGS